MRPIQYQAGLSPNLRRTSRIGILACLILLALTVLLRWLFAHYGLSTLPKWSANDGPYVLAAVVEWLNGGGFDNSLTNFYTEPHWRDGQHSLIAYPPVHMLLMAVLATSHDVFGVYTAVWIMETIGLVLLCATLVAMVFRTGQQERAGMWILALLGLMCAGTLGFGGRPDTTFLAVLSLGCLYAALMPKPNSIVVGMLLGVLGATQPTAALLIASCVAVWFSMLWPGKQAAKQLTLVAASALALSLLALGAYYDVADVVQAIGRSTPQQAFSYFSLPLLLRTQFLDYLRPFSGVVLVVGLSSTAILVLKKGPASAAWLLLGLTSFLIFATHAFIIRPHCTYNSQALLPVFLSVTLLAAAPSKKYRILFSIALLVPALALPLQAMILYDHASRGMSLRSAQGVYEKILPSLPSGSPLGIETPLWPLSADGRDWGRSYHFNWEGPRMKRGDNATLFVREGSSWNRGDSLLQAPRSVIEDRSKGIKHRLWVDCNTKQLVRIMGRNIYAPVTGFAFSVYVPEAWGDWCPMGSACQQQIGALSSCEFISHGG